MVDDTDQFIQGTGVSLRELIVIRINKFLNNLYFNLSVATVSLLLLLYLSVGVYLSIMNTIRDLVKGTDKLASGDLTSDVQLESKDELQQVALSFNKMRNTLAHTINDIKNFTKIISESAKEIALNGNQLAKRADQESTFFEETSATVQGLTTTVKKNAENAKQAHQFAVSASDVALAGGDVVSKVISKMTSINESSRKVSDIILVIDSIAFQTNILALNAAVEAARAGEQGRGFSVVATEVRNLAQRSSNAAKEIKELIENSVENVADGAKLVDKAGQTMEEIVKSIKQVAEIMVEITSASIEQSRTMEEASQSIEQIHMVNKQNKTLVQDAAKNTRFMEDQAKLVNQLISIFRLGNTETNLAATASKRENSDNQEAVSRETGDKKDKKKGEEWDSF
jgi:methyl-accepting chemotaxis protein